MTELFADGQVLHAGALRVERRGVGRGAQAERRRLEGLPFRCPFTVLPLPCRCPFLVLSAVLSSSSPPPSRCLPLTFHLDRKVVTDEVNKELKNAVKQRRPAYSVPTGASRVSLHAPGFCFQFPADSWGVAGVFRRRVSRTPRPGRPRPPRQRPRRPGRPKLRSSVCRSPRHQPLSPRSTALRLPLLLPAPDLAYHAFTDPFTAFP